MIKRLLIAAMGAATIYNAHAVDLQPNDIVPPPPDTNSLMASYYTTRESSLFANGNKISNGPTVDLQAELLRYMRSYDVEGLPGVSYIQGSNGKLTPEGSLAQYPNSSGLGDTTLATAIWPYVNRQTRTYLGVAAYAMLPTGNYSAQRPLNVGSNRYSSDLQIGFQSPLYQNLSAMIAFDTQWFGANSQCAAACGSTSNTQLTEKPLYTTQLGPIYKINNTFTVGASYFYVNGGTTAINNISNNDTTLTQRYLLSALAYTSIGKFAIQYGNDLQTKNGLATSQVLVVRYSKLF